MSKEQLSELGFSQAPHYCTHAIEFLKEMCSELPAQTGLTPDLEAFLVKMLDASIKFLLPDNGYLFEGEHDYKPSMFELLRLPYPICALEFRANQELFAADSGLVHADKRIALCFDPNSLPTELAGDLAQLLQRPSLAAVGLPGACLATMSIYHANAMWGASVGMVVIDLENDTPLPLAKLGDSRPEDPLARKVDARIHPQGANAPNRRMSKHGLPATFHPFPGRAQLVGQSKDEAVEALYIDTIDEIRTAYEFLAAINCSNVGTIEIPAPRMLNAKRQKNQRTPFYPYKILDLSAGSYGESGTSNETGKSVRTHLRRGHIRRLGEKFGNKVLWINATMVKPGSSPLNEPAYKIRP